MDAHSRNGKGRRGHGEGSVYRRSDGYWVASVEAGRCPGGHPKRDGTVCKGGERRRARIVRRTKKQVLAKLDELKGRGSAGVAGKDQTVTEYMTWWLDTVKAADVAAGNLSPSSLATYRAWTENRITPYVGHVLLLKLTPQDIQAMMNRLEANGIGPRARNVAKGLLGAALKHAKGTRLIFDNPADYVNGSKLGAKLDDALDEAELDRCLTAARGDRLYALLFVSATLGLRQNEALALRWDDLDLDAGTMRVDQSKTAAGERTLPLVAGTHDVLKRHRARQLVDQHRAGPLWSDHGLVFTRPDGKPIPPRELVRWWHDVQAKAKVDRRRWHALRHSAVGRMLDRGVPLEVVSAVAGHSGLSITADIYGRPRADRLRRQLADYDTPPDAEAERLAKLGGAIQRAKDDPAEARRARQMLNDLLGITEEP